MKGDQVCEQLAEEDSLTVGERGYEIHNAKQRQYNPQGHLIVLHPRVERRRTFEDTNKIARSTLTLVKRISILQIEQLQNLTYII